MTAGREARLLGLGILCGFAAGAWLGAAEAPTKLVVTGVAPVVISLAMVVGVFFARWTIPALIHGTASIGADLRRTPHLVVWAILAGCLWAVANTLTVYAIRDIGLSIAFPLWNSNSLLGILWGVVFFHELRGSGRSRWFGVLGGAALMFAGATLLALASAAAAGSGGTAAHPRHGIAAALMAGALWGTMYIPYRKAYLTGMNPLSFVTFFTIGELGMMGGLALALTGGGAALWAELGRARPALFWLLVGGFIWVVGDLLQQFAAKYAGISRGIPLSNTNQLWGLAWGILVFGELQGIGAAGHLRVIGGSLLMALGAGAIAIASATAREHEWWRVAAERESRRYGIDPAWVQARLTGALAGPGRERRPIDWLFLIVSVAVFAAAALAAGAPGIPVRWVWVAGLVVAMLLLLFAAAGRLWRDTEFS